MITTRSLLPGLAALLFVALCSCRALTPNETFALDAIYHPGSVRNPVDLAQVTIWDLSSSRDKAVRDAMAQIAEEIETGRFNLARTRMSPDSFNERVYSLLSKVDAITVINNVFFLFHADDYSFFVEDCALLAHEIMHVWQWQNRHVTGFTLAAGMWERIRYKDPYAYEIVSGKRFLDYRYEQQGKIVQDYVSLKALNNPEYRVRERLIEQALDAQTLKRLVTISSQSKPFGHTCGSTRKKRTLSATAH